MSDGRIAMDDGDLIFREYLRNLSLAGRPGVGDAYMRWVHDVRFDETRCTRVTLTHEGDDGTDFAEYPTHHSLASLDPNDRKFVAVAAADGECPVLVVGCDRGWTKHADALQSVGLSLSFLCA